MIPSLLLEEPPARTSAKEPWVSDGVQSGCRGCKAAGEAGEGAIGGFSPSPSSLVISISRSFLELLVPWEPHAEAHDCTNVHRSLLRPLHWASC